MKAANRRSGQVYVNDHPLYNTWCMIKQRCNNPNHPSYYLYGGKGIKMCDKWSSDFWAFVEDIGEKPTPEHTIDRFPDRKGNYEPGNVRWATWSQQNSNRNNYAVIIIREKKNMAFAAYMRKKKVDEKFNREDLINSVKEIFPDCEIK